MWVQPKEYKHVGDALAAARNRAGLTQDELAKLVRKPQSFVSNYERGNRRIDVLELLRIVDAFKTDPRKVFTDTLRAGQGGSGAEGGRTARPRTRVLGHPARSSSSPKRMICILDNSRDVFPHITPEDNI